MSVNNVDGCKLYTDEYENPHSFTDYAGYVASADPENIPDTNPAEHYFLYKINKGTIWEQEIEIIQDPVICNETLTPVEEEPWKRSLQFLPDGAGENFDYTDFFIDNETPGCTVDCKIVDQDASGNCLEEETQQNFVKLTESVKPWTLNAMNSVKEAYSETLCMICTPNLGDKFEKKFLIYQVTDKPPPTGVWTHLFPTLPDKPKLELDYNADKQTEVSIEDFFHSIDPNKPIEMCVMYAEDCKTPFKESGLVLGGLKILIATNDKYGWKRKVCLECNTNEEIRTMEFVWEVEQKPVDCSNKLEV